ncbi:proline-rich family protein [Striga asiatica]|uniref:Proline-rich family protein n=1 Tax=Striga asiatica TaxID=4170 RepID=A0A5A7PYJ1_STRAF|nr:proline-rich family protein [Striga asiatica]
MQASVQFRPQNRDLGMIMREVDEDLAIFLGIRNAEKERNDHTAPVESDEFDESKDLQLKPDCSLPLNSTRENIVPIATEDNFVNFGAEKSDGIWQFSSSPLHSVEVNLDDCTTNSSKTPENEAISVDNSSDSPSDSPPNQNPSALPNKRPSSSSGPHKPTTRSTLPSKPRPASRPSTPNNTSRPGPRPTILKAVGPARPASASRERVVARPNEKPERQQKLCSPPKMRAGIAITARHRARERINNDVNPVLMGTKMVDRVVNCRKLAPPKHDERVIRDRKKSGLENNSGFGRSLSNKSLEMAIRHMDIRRSICDKS